MPAMSCEGSAVTTASNPRTDSSKRFNSNSALARPCNAAALPGVDLQRGLITGQCVLGPSEREKRSCRD